MASQMVVPASKDTLFMRGFSARREIEDIRDFFNRNGGSRCTVEFFKESDDKSKLYLALKFDSKDVAKELLNKYDNTDVLGDRITISWFKDLRRARMKAGNRGRRFNWSPERYNNDYRKDRFHGSGRYSGSWGGQYGSRRRFDRSSSRSRSRSSSRSRSRSASPRRSRSRSNDSHSGSKHKRSRTTSDSRKDRRKRSSEKEKSSHREHSSRDRSASVGRREDSLGREDLEEEEVERQESKQPRDRSPSLRSSKAIRSAVTTVDRPQHDDPVTDDSDDGRDNYPRKNPSDEEPDKHSIEKQSYKEHRKQAIDKLEHREHITKENQEPRGRSFAENSSSIDPKEDAGSFELPPKEHELKYREQDAVKESEPDESFYHRRRYDRELSPPPPPLPPPERPPQNSRYTEKPFREQEYPRNYERVRRSLSPQGRGDIPLHAGREMERVLPPVSDYTESSQPLREREVGYGYRAARDSRSDPRYQENPRDLPGSTPPSLTRGRPMPLADPRDIRSPPILDPEMSPETHVRMKRMYDDDLAMFERKTLRDREFDDPRSLPLRRDTEEFADTKRRRYIDEAPHPQREIRRDYYEERSRLERSAQASGGRMHLGADRERERSPYFDDRTSTGTASSRNVGPQPSFNGNISREADKGVLGLPQDKMSLVREKKDEIEKSYRQDCETFAAVTKMLISKDGSLEDKLQGSLRENLKDIGQRCIHELREFIDRLKSEDDRRPLH